MNLAGLVLALLVLVASALRTKRILYGDVLHSFGPDFQAQKYTSPYDAVYYTVGMKPAWGRAVFGMEFNDPKGSWDAQAEQNSPDRAAALWNLHNNRCGGSFLTPKVVQTACRCVAFFFDDKKTNKVVWEEPLAVYASISRSQTGEMWGPGIYSPRRYYAHVNCRLWRREMTRIVSYDYAIMTLSKGNWGMNDPPNDFPGFVKFYTKTAPLYTSEDLDFNYMERGLPNFTWRTVTGYRFCHDFLKSVLNFTSMVAAPTDDGEPLKWEGPDPNTLEPGRSADDGAIPGFRNSATFSCSMNAGKFQATTVPGDSGYPVTCNNVYFALQGIGWTKGDRMDRMSVESPINYAKSENAAEYRDDLLAQLKRWNPTTRNPNSRLFRKFDKLDLKKLSNSAWKASKPYTFSFLIVILLFIRSKLTSLLGFDIVSSSFAVCTIFYSTF